MVTSVIQAAIIVERGLSRWWLCPSCRKTLGEVTSERVIIKVKDRRIVVCGQTVSQVCPQCGEKSEVQTV